MKKRILTGSIIFVVLALVFVLREFVSSYVFDIFVIALSAISSLEMALMYKSDKKVNAMRISLSWIFIFFFYATYLAMALTNMTLGFTLIVLFAVFAVFVLTILITCLCLKSAWGLDKKSLSKLFSSCIICLIYPFFLLACLFFINRLDLFNSNLPIRLGLFFTLLVFVVASCTDMFALYGGVLLKGPKLCPKISPKKTISGAIVGAIFGTASAVVMFYIFSCFSMLSTLFFNYNISVWAFLIYGFVSSILSQIGDLLESLIKRIRGVKDSGTIFPGHGGFLDRLDSISVVALSTFIFAIILFL